MSEHISHSNPSIQVPRAATNGEHLPAPLPPGVPELPPSVAKHPLYATIVIVVSMIGTLLGGVYALVPSDKQLETVKEELQQLRAQVQRSLDKSESKVGLLERDMANVRTYHDAVNQWQVNTNSRLNKLELQMELRKQKQ